MRHTLRHAPFARAVLFATVLSASSHAFATCNPDNGGCDGGGYSESFLDPIAPGLALSSSATQNAQGSWDYVYTLTRTGSEPGGNVYLDKFTLPYFEDAQITNLRLGGDAVPSGRSVEITHTWIGDPVIQSSTTYDYYWADMPAKPDEIRFTSPFAPGAQNTAIVQLGGFVQFGGDFYGNSYTIIVTAPPAMSFGVTLPGSPLAIAASIPEPGNVSLMLTGLCALAAFARRQGRGRAA